MQESPPLSPEEVLSGIQRRIKAAPAPAATALLGAPGLERNTRTPEVELPAGPFPAVCAWLLALGTPPPPYVVALVELLQRIGAGEADDADRERFALWWPSGVRHARLVADRDPAAGAALLAELVPQGVTHDEEHGEATELSRPVPQHPNDTRGSPRSWPPSW